MPRVSDRLMGIPRWAERAYMLPGSICCGWLRECARCHLRNQFGLSWPAQSCNRGHRQAGDK